jgi:hypothetical protein
MSETSLLDRTRRSTRTGGAPVFVIVVEELLDRQVPSSELEE